MSQSVPEERLGLYRIFIDESCVTGHRWMALGGTIVSATNYEAVAISFANLKAQIGMAHEIKWERVSAKNVARYKRIVDTYFAFSRANILRFHSVTIPMFWV